MYRGASEHLRASPIKHYGIIKNCLKLISSFTGLSAVILPIRLTFVSQLFRRKTPMQKTILITGATDGIGLATANALAQQGHNLLIHGRSAEKLAAAEASIQQRQGKGTVETFLADLSSLEAVCQLATEVLSKHSSIDVLINNAGVLRTSNPMTAQGLDVRMLVNTLAPALLTTLLSPALSWHSRVINLSSAAQATVDTAFLEGKKTAQSDMDAYAQSKLALTIWPRQTALRQNDEGPALAAVNPGSLLASKMVQQGFGVAGNDISIGVDILTEAALDERFAQPEGRYFDNDSGRFSEPHPDGQNPEKAATVMATIDRLIAPFIA